MLRQNSSTKSAPAERNKPTQPETPSQTRAVDFNIQRELNRVEELILDSPRIPFTGRTLVDEDKLLNQLDVVRINLPDAFEKALEVIRNKQEILLEAQDYAQKMIEAAQRRAAQILDETGIVQRAELQASQIRQQVQQECEAIQQKTISEIEQMRRAGQQELGQIRKQALAESEEIQKGADEYAEAVLTRIEQQLSEMLTVVHNGRQQLQNNSNSRSSKSQPKPKNPPGNKKSRS